MSNNTMVGHLILCFKTVGSIPRPKTNKIIILLNFDLCDPLDQPFLSYQPESLTIFAPSALP